MVQRVKTPEGRHRVLAPMHGVTQQIKQQKTGDKAQPEIPDRPNRKAYCFKVKPDGRSRGQEECDEKEVSDPEADVADAPTKCTELSPASWKEEFA
jgi:hypothetical protein